MSETKSTDLARDLRTDQAKISNCACSKFMLEKRQSALFGRLEIFFDDIADYFSLTVTEIHGFGIGQTTTHVPDHFQCFLSYGFGLLIHAIYYLTNAVRVRDQEPDTKKRAMSMVNTCSY
jgi:hypothetical protein